MSLIHEKICIHLGLGLSVVHHDVGGLVHQLSHLPHGDHPVEVQIHLVRIMFVECQSLGMN